jgi:hypothetical protein
MLKPKTINIFNNKINQKPKNVRFENSTTLEQVLYKKNIPNPITINDILGKKSILKDNIFETNNNVNNNTLLFNNNIINQTNVKEIEPLNSDEPLNINKDNSSKYSTELIESSDSFSSNPNKNKTKIQTNSKSETESISETKSESESESESENESETESKNKSERKFYWEYGNTGLKIRDFKKKMSRNLAIMYYIDRLFNEYIDTILSNNYSKLFNPKTNVKFNLKTGSIKSINGKVSVSLNHDKIKGNFSVKEAGFVTINDIKIKDNELKNNSIPNLKSILSHKENINHIVKITKLLNFYNKMNIVENLSTNNFKIENITKNANMYIDDLIKKNKKNKILKSNKYTGFYIKVYSDHTKGFIIDNLNNVIHYISANINFDIKSINVRYYTFDITRGKIVKNE